MKQFLFTLTILGFSLLCSAYSVNSISGIATTPNTGFEISGRVLSTFGSEPLAGVSIRIIGSDEGCISDVHGEFTLYVTAGDRLQISYVGYETIELAVDENSPKMEVVMDLDLHGLMNVVVVGSRFAPRSVMASPVPIDNITARDLSNTGQMTLDQMINFRVQSFNTSQQTISDATAHFNPADIRGLGPSRTLVLINGKRKNPSALVFINDTPGKGEVGVDMQSIPVGAIERVEILRDGASAQYGSDAIGGVINIILKKDVEQTNLELVTGVTKEGDGFNFGYNVNTGFKILEEGYLNVTTSFRDQQATNRAGKPGEDVIFGGDSTDPWIQANPDLGMGVGQPEMATFDIFYNASVPIKKGREIYSFGGSTIRNGKSLALYRTPHMVSDPHYIFHRPGETYEGFQPTFETDVQDKTIGLGIRGEIEGWKLDVSTVSGSNAISYHVKESLNESMGINSPTSFFAGEYKFSNMVGNLDLFKKYKTWNIGFGSEFRMENFISSAGEQASHIGEGVVSFPGIQPRNEVDKKRYNIGFYSNLEYDDDVFLIGGAARVENYDDFGQTINWKLNSRVRLWNKRLTLRTSASTGFRAPSLHQIYLSNIQTLVAAGTLSNQGTFNHESAVLRGLGVPELKQEESLNVSAGITFNPVPNLEMTLDYYRVAVNDRILLTNEIKGDTTEMNAVQAILSSNEISSLKFFVNAVDTRTEGLDLVITYGNVPVGSGRMYMNFAANINQTRIEGKIRTPSLIEESGNEIFNRKEQARIVSGRPVDKFLFGAGYDFRSLNVNLHLTRFGEVTWKHADGGVTGSDFDQTFSPKVITDLNVSYSFPHAINFGLTINNLLNIYPDEIDNKGDPLTDLGGRFKYPWEVNQFGFLGTVFTAKVNFKF